MYYSMRGKVLVIKEDFIVLEVNNIGYEIFISHSDNFYLEQEVLVYLHEVVREDEHYLVGFASLEEKEVFMSLISVKGIGPKTALGALSATTPSNFINAIENSDIKYLKKLPGIGPKAASQIVLDLKGHLVATEVKVSKNKLTGNLLEVHDALKTLGFKSSDIEKVLNSLKDKEGIGSEALLKEALRLLRKWYYGKNDGCKNA